VLAPLALRRRHNSTPTGRHGRALLYFAAIGTGYLWVELAAVFG
jgi:hypothetical protein